MYNVLLFLQIASVAATIICVAILGYERNRIQQKLLMITIICAFNYCLGYSVELLSTTLSQAMAALKMEYVGGCFLVSSYIAFLVKYLKKQHNRIIFGYFLVIDIMTLVAVLRMEVCDWYYKSLGFSYSGLFPHIVIERGPLYYIFFANNFVLILYGFVIIVQELVNQRKEEVYKNSPIKKRTLVVLLITTTIPFAPYIIGSLGIASYIDFVPIAFLLAAIILLVIVLRDNIFDVVTGAHEQMLSTMHDAVIVVNSQMEFLEANKAAVQIFPSLFNYQIEKKCPEEVIRVFQNLDNEVSLDIKGRCYERHSSKVYKESTLIGYSALLIDVTENNELMNQLREMKNQADQANKAKSTFLANVSHELRTPLNAVLGYSDLIIQETESRIEADHAYAIRKAADNLLSIINSILDISKIESGKIDIVKAEYNTMELFTEVVNIISIPAKNKGLKLVVDIDPTIPSMLYGDKDHIRQVLINLLNNAVKFTDEGEVKLEVRRKKGGTGFAEITYNIIDTGTGIKSEDLKVIFERFEQGSNEKLSNVEGTGLGLYISKSLIGLMGGTLTVESNFGSGSTFTIQLVQRVCSEDTIDGLEMLARNNEEVKTKLNLYAPKARVLSVDDNMVNNGVFYEFCKRFGIEAVLADSGSKGIELLKKHQFDLVFLDQMMPGMDGIETLRKIREIEDLNPKMSIIAFTANAIRGNTEYLMSHGFDDVVTKPIGITELEEVLVYYLPKEVQSNRDEKQAKQAARHQQEQLQETLMEEAMSETAADKEDLMFDKEIGLEHCNYDKDLYRQTLQMLVNYVPDKLDCMEEYVQKKDYPAYVIEVHALKNNAALIGATVLSEEAKRLEYAGREGRYEEINESSASLIRKFKEMLGQIEKNIDRNDWL